MYGVGRRRRGNEIGTRGQASGLEGRGARALTTARRAFTVTYVNVARLRLFKFTSTYSSCSFISMLIYANADLCLRPFMLITLFTLILIYTNTAYLHLFLFINAVSHLC